jgi:hypothetical protein
VNLVSQRLFFMCVFDSISFVNVRLASVIGPQNRENRGLTERLLTQKAMTSSGSPGVLMKSTCFGGLRWWGELVPNYVIWILP